MNWLVKEEPTHYGWDAFAKDRRAVWSGVRNPMAQRHLRDIKKGDRVFYYHTGNEKAVVGIARAVSGPHPDPEDSSGKYVAVDLAPVTRLPRPVTLAEIKADPSFTGFLLVRIARLSVMPVTDAQWARIERMAGTASKPVATGRAPARRRGGRAPGPPGRAYSRERVSMRGSQPGVAFTRMTNGSDPFWAKLCGTRFGIVMMSPGPTSRLSSPSRAVAWPRTTYTTWSSSSWVCSRIVLTCPARMPTVLICAAGANFTG
jgi:predicted RNA-binding protein with PUA-like domain